MNIINLICISITCAIGLFFFTFFEIIILFKKRKKNSFNCKNHTKTKSKLDFETLNKI